MNIICLSSQAWHDDLWTNKQHIMSRLAKRGHCILYVSKEVRSFPEFIASWFRKKQSPYKHIGIHKLAKNLSISNSYYLPFSGFFPAKKTYSDFPFKLDLIQSTFSKLKSPIFWIYHPEYGDYLDKLPKDAIIIYDCVDDYGSFPEYQEKEAHARINQAEEKLLKRADLVFTTSLGLYDKKKSLNKNCHYIHNVGDFEHFNQVATQTFGLPSDLATIQGPKVGFFGNLSPNKVDFALIQALAIQNPKINFILIGPFQQKELETSIDMSLNNLHFLGQKSYDQLPAYISHLDILSIPYQINPHTEHVFPIKFFECLATGKPVISTALPSLKDFANSIHTIQSESEGSQVIQTLLSQENDSDQQKRLELAKTYDWDYRINRLLDKIKDLDIPGDSP